jgi:tRNA1Val (adenine37-N6)-methyltransferase
MLLPGERIDETGFSNLRLIQKPDEFCYGVDAVILADFASKKKAAKMVDLGTGTGIVPIILSHKTNAEFIYGIEYQKDSFDRAVRNIELNGLENRLGFINANVAEFGELKEWADAVTTNPPYMVSNGAITNDNTAKTIARHETVGNLDDFVSCAAGILKNRGNFYIVHRPSRLVDIFTACRKYRLEPKEIRFVAPRKGERPNIVLVHCVKNGGAELKILEDLYVYEEPGVYSEEIQRIYERIK